MREIIIESGAVAIRARLLETQTADILWRALPLHSTAEIWGEEVHFDVPIESYLESGAKALVSVGEIAFLPDGDAISVPYGRTPISKPGEVRLWSPGNVFAVALDDVTRLRVVHVGSQISMVRFGEMAAAAAEPTRRRSRSRKR